VDNFPNAGAGMTAGQPTLRQQRQAERFAAYAALRDAGALVVDAGREAGLAYGTREKYERAYRKLRGLTNPGWRGMSK
jgi:hypothetical protein